jgi:hypothetical protein
MNNAAHHKNIYLKRCQIETEGSNLFICKAAGSPTFGGLPLILPSNIGRGMFLPGISST